MYVISRVMSFQKGNDEQIKRVAQKSNIMSTFPGFVRKDVLLDQRDPEKDIVRILVYWENKQAFYKFEGSKEHIEMHKNKDHAHNHKPEGLIEVVREAYQVIHSDVHGE